jgi:hypothetical protein
MENSFFFCKAVLKFHFQEILNSFLNSVKTTQLINKYAIACMPQHMSNLIFDFKFIKKLLFPLC